MGFSFLGYILVYFSDSELTVAAWQMRSIPACMLHDYTCDNKIHAIQYCITTNLQIYIFFRKQRHLYIHKWYNHRQKERHFTVSFLVTSPMEWLTCLGD